MPKEIIDEIRRAEAEAYRIRVEAEKNSKEAFDRASKEAEKMTEDALKRASEENAAAIEAAKAAARERIDASRIASYENAAVATEISASRTDQAVKAVVDHILGV